jgi:hypothetical protein
MLTVKDIIGRYISMISKEIKIDSIEEVSNGVYKVFTCNTKWAMVGYFAEVRQLDAETNEFIYTQAAIIEVKFNEYFVINSSIPIDLGIRLTPLHFRSGTILQTREEIKNEDFALDPVKRTPMIFVREVAGEQWASKYNDSVERRNLDIPEIYFLSAMGRTNLTTNEAYEDAVYPMLNVVRLFEKVLYNFKAEVSRFQTIDLKYHTKFAVQTRVGNTEWVFDEGLAGVEAQLDISLLVDYLENCKCEDVQEPAPIPVSGIVLRVNSEVFKEINTTPYTLRVENSQGLAVGLLDPTNNLVIVPDSVAEINGIEVLTIPSGATSEIKVLQNGVEVGSLVGGDWVVPVCADASYRVQYENGTLIQEGTIPSGGSIVVDVPNIVPCADATWELRDSDGVLLDSGSIASGGSATITAPNGAVTITDSDGATLYVVNVTSGGTETQAIGDSTVEVRNSLNSIVDSGVVKAQGSGVFNAPDASVTVNGDASFGTIPSDGSENILVENTDGAPVGAFDINSNSWVVADSTVNVRKSDATLIQAVTVAAEDTESVNVADSTAVLKDTAANVISSTNIKATESEDIVAPDGSLQNSDASATLTVRSGELNKPIADINVEVNTVVEGSIPAIKDVKILITDGVNPVTPDDVSVVGDTVTVEVPSGASPSGVLFKTIEPAQYTSYRTGDEGWRVQNNWFDYTPPINPKAIAELDYTNANYFSILKNPLIVNGVSSTTRFVDINGVQAFTSTGNADLVVIDKLTGMMYVRYDITAATWDNQIDDALLLSLTINSVIYDDWYVASRKEVDMTVHHYAGISVINDPATGARLWPTGASTNWTSTTNANGTFAAWRYLNFNRSFEVHGKGNVRSAYAITNVRHLITAP